MYKVFIGVGHGGNDPGAIGSGLREADVNLTMAQAMQAELLRHGITVGISRVTDENDTLTEEIQEANAFAPDLAVECHNNAGGGDGFEVFRQTNSYAAKSTKLAQAIEVRVKEIGQNSRGVKTRLNASGTDYFGWLRQVKCPAVLCEGAFLDNATDVQIIDTEAEQRAFGEAYAKGVLDYLGIAWKAPAASTGATAARYKVVEQKGAYSEIARAKTAAESINKAGGYAYVIER